ncbi:type I-E CRISPR-associated protein Cse2/CasB [Streptomyces sp. NRRL WC-3549]|uniref:type I-E CRISPR-associated protein Cse2/CasB n=1 Tax=Streptomyces sp. NRRL WC-3549 TaxID=1463925 RepID=UPI0009EC6371|nr:type I-E CRISPR-associated protein Cse2/CasB [Streptomyces sp. NRRL WC-3549]
MTTASTQPPVAGSQAPPKDSVEAAAIPQQSAGARTHRSRAFTRWVEETCAKDPGARTALRSGLRKDLDAVPRMHRLIAPWLPETPSPDVERAYYAVAAMIAAQPRSALRRPDHAEADPARGEGERRSGAPETGRFGASLGTTFALAVVQGPGREKEMRAGTAEARLNLLTRQSPAGLHRHLPASVSYLCSLGVDVDWAQVLDDLSHWRRHSGRISRRWLQDFYRLRAKDPLADADGQDAQELQQPQPVEEAPTG